MTEQPAERLAEEHRAAKERLAALTREYDGVVAASESSNADDEHDPEGSTIAFERSQLGALIEQARSRVREVEAAQARLADGSYGMCESCGRPIAAGRLEARPTARRCIDCAR
ncbi:MAG TPA: TraR/DksA C4-type zinc finger protein [Nocardioidaceae bacterium]|nr:TraR/DksA C4-type zinc finger protein [Nocardioidaceae bacterium]